MSHPFSPHLDFISPSLNQVRIMELPGLALPPDVRGQLGYNLLSASGLRQLVAPHTAVLGLDPTDPHLLPHFDACLTAVGDAGIGSQCPPPSPIRTTAEAIAQAYGRRLGYLLLTLKRGDPANRAARPTWGDAQWEFWAQVRQVWLGGGVVSGHLGPLAAATAQEMLHTAGFPEMCVRISPQPALLPLLGAARLAPAGTAVSLVFDFGHTNVKRALAMGGATTGSRWPHPTLHLWPTLPAGDAASPVGSTNIAPGRSKRPPPYTRAS